MFLNPSSVALLLSSLVTLVPVASADGCAGQDNTSWGEDPTRSNEGPIVFKLTPKGVKDGRFIVEVQVDTHSGDLKNLNLKEQTRLNLEGISYAPLEDVRLGGHHARDTLVFLLQNSPREFEIVIHKVGTMGDVSFRWP